MNFSYFSPPLFARLIVKWAAYIYADLGFTDLSTTSSSNCSSLSPAQPIFHILPPVIRNTFYKLMIHFFSKPILLISFTTRICRSKVIHLEMVSWSLSSSSAGTSVRSGCREADSEYGIVRRCHCGAQTKFEERVNSEGVTTRSLTCPKSEVIFSPTQLAD